MIEFYPEGILIEKPENAGYFKSINALNEAFFEEKILEARAVICDAEHNLIVDMGCIKGIIPREEGALGIKEGRVRDIAIISRVNRPVSFVITDFKKNTDGATVAILSRSKAQQRCMQQYIASLSSGDVINARITHLEPFGAFADVGCGIVSLIDRVFVGNHKITACIVPGRESTIILNFRTERDGISICLCVNFPNIPVREPDLHIIAVHLRPQCPAKLLFLTKRRNFKFKLSRRGKIPHNAFL